MNPTQPTAPQPPRSTSGSRRTIPAGRKPGQCIRPTLAVVWVALTVLGGVVLFRSSSTPRMPHPETAGVSLTRSPGGRPLESGPVPERIPSSPSVTQPQSASPSAQTAVGFHWSQVESADYRTYIANLRAIGCPESTIRDIIVADVRALYRALHQGGRSIKANGVMATERQVLEALGVKEEEGPERDEAEVPSEDQDARASREPPGPEAVAVLVRVMDEREALIASLKDREPNQEELNELRRLEEERLELLGKSVPEGEMDAFAGTLTPEAMSVWEGLNGIEVTREEFNALAQLRKRLDASFEAAAVAGITPDVTQLEVEFMNILGDERYARYLGQGGPGEERVP